MPLTASIIEIELKNRQDSIYQRRKGQATDLTVLDSMLPKANEENESSIDVYYRTASLLASRKADGTHENIIILDDGLSNCRDDKRSTDILQSYVNFNERWDLDSEYIPVLLPHVDTNFEDKSERSATPLIVISRFLDNDKQLDDVFRPMRPKRLRKVVVARWRPEKEFISWFLRANGQMSFCFARSYVSIFYDTTLNLLRLDAGMFECRETNARGEEVNNIPLASILSSRCSVVLFCNWFVVSLCTRL